MTDILIFPLVLSAMKLAKIEPVTCPVVPVAPVANPNLYSGIWGTVEDVAWVGVGVAEGLGVEAGDTAGVDAGAGLGDGVGVGAGCVQAPASNIATTNIASAVVMTLANILFFMFTSRL